MKSVETRSGNSERAESGFTRLDLLVTVLTLVLVTFTLLPAIARTHVDSQGTECLNNLRQLSLAWIMYSDDSNGKLAPNRGIFPPNPDHSPSGGVANRARWVGGDMRGGSIGLPYAIIDVYNTNLLVDPNFSLLGPYVRHPALFKCPADLSTWMGKPRVRSYSMNGAIGCAYNGTSTDPGHAATGHWLPGQYSSGPWRVYLKKSDLTGSLAAADLMLLVEEHPDSINDATFEVQMPLNPAQTQWIDMPTKVHNNAANFSFADGHVETHQWQMPQAILPLLWAADFAYIGSGPGLATTQDPDIKWVAHHTSALIPGVSENIYQP